MLRQPFLVASTVVLSAAAWSLRLATDPEPFSPSSAAVIAAGLVLYAVVAVAGMVLARGRWSRRLATLVVTAGAGIAVVVELDALAAAALAVSALALVAMWGPWLDGWLRKLPSADGPPTVAILVALGVPGALPIVGVASPAGLEPLHGVLAGTGLLLGWGYSRAELWALWGIRLTTVPLAVAAAFVSPLAGGLALVAWAVAVTTAAWSRQARHAVDPLMDRLPGPRVASPKHGETG